MFSDVKTLIQFYFFLFPLTISEVRYGLQCSGGRFTSPSRRLGLLSLSEHFTWTMFLFLIAKIAIGFYILQMATILPKIYFGY